MAKTDWSITDVVRPQDMNNIGAEINQLRDDVDHIEVPQASTTQAGIVQLSNATDGKSEKIAATEKALGLVMKEAQEGKQAGNERKAQAVAVLNAKGVSATVAESWDSIIAKLTALVVATGNAELKHVLAGKTFSNVSGNNLVGTMPNRGGYVSATSAGQWGDGALAAYFPEGYYGGGINGGAEIKVTLEQLQAADPDLNPSNFLETVIVYGMQGAIPHRSNRSNHTQGVQASVWPGDRFFIMPPHGYYDGSTWVTAAVPGLTPNNVRAGVPIADMVGTMIEGRPITSGTFNVLTGQAYYTISGIGFRPRTIIITSITGDPATIIYSEEISIRHTPYENAKAPVNIGFKHNYQAVAGNITVSDGSFFIDLLNVFRVQNTTYNFLAIG